MTTTLGASSPGCGGVGHHGVDSAWYRPISPSNGSYGFIAVLPPRIGG